MAQLCNALNTVFKPAAGDISVASDKSGAEVQMRYGASGAFFHVCDIPGGREIIVTVTAKNSTTGPEYKIVSNDTSAVVYAYDAT